ncbi:MAG: hypothetical protein L0Z52_12025 [Acidobacteria bacterium]|nr:hypothetical protein [Acidobacteriota bacterium]
MTSENGAPADRCRFLSSLGGVHHCPDPVYREGFCHFHFEAFLREEVLANGQLSERLTDQHRRRALNYHGIPLEPAPNHDPFHR